MKTKDNAAESSAAASAVHTPGPWKIDRYHRSRAPFGISMDTGNPMENKSVINSGGFARKRTDEAEANARLIAAAPELLEALEAILSDKELIYTGGGYASLEEAGLDGTDHLAAKARAAIRKARGQ